MDPYARSLLLSNPIREPLIRQAIAALRLPPGSRGLDAGCGIGLQALLLGEAVKPDGHVTGLDGSDLFVEMARERLSKASLANRVSFHTGDWRSLPFKDGEFDWAWSADAVGYAPGRPGEEIGELARVVRPGGTVALLIWSSQMLLPGYPELEARLNATQAGIAPFRPGLPPEQHYLRLLGWLRQGGLVGARLETFIHSVCAPLSEEVRQALTALFQMRWGEAQAELSAEDLAACQRLCQPESSDFILNCPDYYAFFTCSLFTANTPG